MFLNVSPPHFYVFGNTLCSFSQAYSKPSTSLVVEDASECLQRDLSTVRTHLKYKD